MYINQITSLSEIKTWKNFKKSYNRSTRTFVWKKTYSAGNASRYKSSDNELIIPWRPHSPHILFANDLSPKLLILFPYPVLCICKHYNIILQLPYHNFFTAGSQHILQLLSNLALHKWIIAKWRSLQSLHFLKVKTEVQTG